MTGETRDRMDPQDAQISRLVRLGVALQNLNRAAEARLGLSLVQFHLLSTLRDMPGCSPQRLADAAGLHPSTLTQSLKRLQRKDALFVGVDPRDSRKKILSLTRTGRDLADAFANGVGGLLDSGRHRDAVRMISVTTRTPR